MTPKLSIATLRASGLTVDWMTVYVARNPPDWNCHVPFAVSIDDVQEVAIAALADCDLQDEDALFRIADDTTHWHGDIDHYLTEFANKSGVSETDALRKWRYVYLKDVLEPLTKWINGPRLPGGDYLPNVTDIDGETQWDFEYYVAQWDIAPKPPPLFGQTRTETLHNFDLFRAWLTQEKAELMTYQNRRNDVPTLL